MFYIYLFLYKVEDLRRGLREIFIEDTEWRHDVIKLQNWKTFKSKYIGSGMIWNLEMLIGVYMWTVTSAVFRFALAVKEKQRKYNEIHEKLILQHSNARPHVAKIEIWNGKSLPYPQNSPNVAHFDYHLFRLIAPDLIE